MAKWIIYFNPLFIRRSHEWHTPLGTSRDNLERTLLEEYLHKMEDYNTVESKISLGEEFHLICFQGPQRDGEECEKTRQLDLFTRADCKLDFGGT